MPPSTGSILDQVRTDGRDENGGVICLSLPAAVIAFLWRSMGWRRFLRAILYFSRYHTAVSLADGMLSC